MWTSTDARRRDILTLLDERGSVGTDELVDRFGVSAVTARRDLRALAEAGVLLRARGGALRVPRETTARGDSSGPVAPPEAGPPTPAGAAPAPAALLEACAALVRPGSSVGVAGGDEWVALACHLRRVPGVSLVTGSVALAHEMRGRDEVLVLGGTLTARGALVGPLTDSALADVRVDLVLLSVEAVDRRHGVTAASPTEAETARRWVAAGRSVCGVALEGKAVGRVALHAVVGLDRLDRLLVAPTQTAQVLYRERADREGPEALLVDGAGPRT